MDTKNKPASAQSREEEALGQIAKIEQSHCYTQNGTPDWIALQDDLRKIGDIALAALRSRQPSTAADDIKSEIGTILQKYVSLPRSLWDSIPASIKESDLRPLLDELIGLALRPRLEAARPSSPQGEEAEESGEWDRLTKKEMWETIQEIRQHVKSDGTQTIIQDIEKRIDEAREEVYAEARLASAQSSAQGEEAREMREGRS